MANNPFDTTNYGLRERPVSVDWNQLQSQIYMTMREVHRFLHAARTSNTSSVAKSVSGFHGAGFRVVPSSPAAMTVSVSAGLGWLHAPTDTPSGLGATDLEGVDDLSPYKPLCALAAIPFNVPTAPAAPNSRIDIIEVRNPRRLENLINRRQLDPNTLSYEDHTFSKTLAYLIDNNQASVVFAPNPSTAPLSYKVGVAANPGLVPPTSPDYIKIAEILVDNTTTSITGLNIVDRRALLGIGGTVRANVSFTATWNAGASHSDISGVVVNAPPGVDIVVGTEAGDKGGFFCYGTAGEVAQITRQANVEGQAALNAGEAITFLPITPAVGFGNVDTGVTIPEPLFTVTSAIQTAMAAHGLSVGIGQRAFAISAGNGQVTFRNAAGVGNQTDAKLNVLIYNVEFALSY